jgi:hypothetical protein
MPILVEWTNRDDHILTISYSGRWTWDDFYDADEQMRLMIDAIGGKAHLIIDVSRNVWIPPELAQNADVVVSSLDPRLGVIVLVGREINRELMGLLAEQNDIINTRYHFAFDLETANRIIHDHTDSR